MVVALVLCVVSVFTKPSAALAAGPTMTITGREDGSEYFGTTKVHFAHANQGAGGAAYCAQGWMISPSPGETFSNAGWPGIPELDYVLYHGWDGTVVTSVHGLTGKAARSATTAAVWLAIGDQRYDLFKANDGDYHGNKMSHARWAMINNAAVKQAAWDLYQEGLAYKNRGGGGIEARCTTLWTTGHAGIQYMVTADKSLAIRLAKRDAQTDGSTQGKASFAGAVFQVTDSAGRVQSATTGADGRTPDIDVAMGTITVRETKAPVGYKLDPTVHRFLVSIDGGVSTLSAQSASLLVDEVR